MQLDAELQIQPVCIRNLSLSRSTASWTRANCLRDHSHVGLVPRDGNRSTDPAYRLAKAGHVTGQRGQHDTVARTSCTFFCLVSDGAVLLCVSALHVLMFRLLKRQKKNFRQPEQYYSHPKLFYLLLIAI